MIRRPPCPRWCIADHTRNVPGIAVHRSAEMLLPVSGDLEFMASLLPITEILSDELTEALLAGVHRVWLEVRVAGITRYDTWPGPPI